MKKIYFISCFFLLAFHAKSQWVADTSVRNVICDLANQQYQPRICSDGHNGAILCWTDVRKSPRRIYAQRIDSAGYVQWALNGVAASDTTLTVGVFNPEIVTDSAGGAIISYETSEAHQRIFAVRIDDQGNRVWPSHIVVDTVYDARTVNISSDDNGGAVLSWHRSLSVGGYHIFVQWIDKDGTIHLPANGLQITTSSRSHLNCHSAYAGDSTAYVVYAEADTLRLVSFDSTGIILWNNPITVPAGKFSTFENEYAIRANPGGNHNAYVFWKDTRSAKPGIYGQRVDENGNQLWKAGGKPIDSTITTVTNISVASDSVGGNYIAYGGSPVRVQRVNANGQDMFVPHLTMCSTGTEISGIIKNDGATGAIIAWQDGRGNNGVYAQRVDSSGNQLWRDCGAPVFTKDNAGAVNDMHAISRTDGTGIAFITNQGDVYCAKIENYVTPVGIPELDPDNSIEVFPNPSKGTINIRISGRENIPSVMTFSDITGRKIYEIRLTQPTTSLNPNLPAGLYFITLSGKNGRLIKKIIIE